MLEWLGPILGAIVAAIAGMVISGLVWKGKVEEVIKQLRADHENHIAEASQEIGAFRAVQREQAVMRAEVMNMSARLVAGDERLKELNVLSRNFAVMESQLKGINETLQRIEKQLEKGQ